jgi:hypothetical protein
MAGAAPHVDRALEEKVSSERKPLPTLVDPVTGRPIVPVAQRAGWNEGAPEDIQSASPTAPVAPAPPTGAVPPPPLPPPAPGMAPITHFETPTGHGHGTADQIMAAPAEFFFEMPERKKQEVITPASIAAAGVAAFVGSIFWVILSFVWYEAPWMATLVGAGIGLSSMYAGGRGTRMGLICAGLTVFALMVGRVATVRIAWEEFEVTVSSFLDDPDVRAEYEEVFQVAQEYNATSSEQELREFLVKHELVWSTNVRDVTTAEVEGFLESDTAETLSTFCADYPTFEDYQKALSAEINNVMPRAPSPLNILSSSFLELDMILVVFGVIAAFAIGGKRDGDA